MIRDSIGVRFVVSLFSLLLYVYACDTNPKIKQDGITLYWPVYEFKIGQYIFYNWHGDDEDKAAKNVTVCVEGRPDIECSKTNERGYFELKGVPKNSEVFLSLKKKGYISRLVHIKTAERDINIRDSEIFAEITKLNTSPVYMFPAVFESYGENELVQDSNADCDLQIEASISPEAEYGEIAAIALEFSFDKNDYPIEGNPLPPVRKTKVSIIPDKNGTATDPIYTDKKGVPCYRDEKGDRGIEEGYALFTKLAPGNYRVAFDVPDTYFCIVASIMADRMFWGVRTETRNQTWVKVKAGHNTNTAIKCYPTKNTDDAGAQFLDSGRDEPSNEKTDATPDDAGLDSQIDNTNSNDEPSENDS